MEALTLDLFILPGIILLFVMRYYFYFARKTEHFGAYRNYIVAIVLLGTFLNAIWEFAHAPLYRFFAYDVEHMIICLLAALADMLLLLFLFFAFGLLYGDIHWIRQLSLSRMFVLVLFGGAGAIIGEIWHTTRGDWYYTDAMPMIPLLDVGIYPVLQFMLLPLIVFTMVRKIC